jgi:hypothetical protein
MKQDLDRLDSRAITKSCGAAYASSHGASRQNQSREAREALAKAIDLLRFQCPQLDSADLGREWPELLIAQNLRREAEALLAGKSGSNALATSTFAIRPGAALHGAFSGPGD